MSLSQLLSDAELLAIVAALGGPDAPRRDLERAIRWAEQVRVDAAMLELITQGRVRVAWSQDRGDWMYQLSD